MQTSSVTIGARARSGPLGALRGLVVSAVLLLAAACSGGINNVTPPAPAAPSNLNYPNTQATVGVAVRITPTVTGLVQTYTSPGLPAPLALDPNTGIITGTLAAALPPTACTVTASNNVGSTSWTFTLSASVQGAPAITRFGTAQTQVAAGVPTMLSWSLTGATSVSIDNNIGDVTGSTWVRVNPGATTTYTLTAVNASGASWSTATLTVTGQVTYQNAFKAPATPVSLPVHDGTTHLMGDRKVVMTAGDTTATLVYDLQSGQVSSGQPTSIQHQGGTSVALPDGLHVLIFGGEDASGNPVAGVDQLILNGDGTVSSQAMQPMLLARTAFTVSLLPNGKLVIAGGLVSATDATAAVELYDPAVTNAAGQVIGQATSLGNLAQPSAGHGAMVYSGKVYLLNGYNSTVVSRHVANVQIIDPVAQTCSLGTALPEPAFASGLADLGNGKALLAGGEAEGDVVVTNGYVFDPSAASGQGGFTATGPMTGPRHLFTPVPLANGTVLVAGGTNTAGNPDNALASSEVFDPVAMTFTALTGSPMATPRQSYRPAKLPNGSVLFPGGTVSTDASGNPSFTDAVEFFN